MEGTGKLIPGGEVYYHASSRALMSLYGAFAIRNIRWAQEHLDKLKEQLTKQEGATHQNNF